MSSSFSYMLSPFQGISGGISSRIIIGGISLLALVLGGLLPVDFANGQGAAKTLPIPDAFNTAKLEEFDESKPDEKKEKLTMSKAMREAEKEYKDFALDAMGGKKDYRTDEAKFDNWFKSVVVPRMTLADAASLRSLPTKRAKFFSDYIENPNSKSSGNPELKQAALQHLTNDILYPLLAAIVTDSDEVSFAKPVKVNAMIMIGSLDVVEGKARDRAPRPLPVAMDFLLKAMLSDKVPDYLKATAMIGVERHVLIDAQKRFANDSLRNAAKKVALDLLGEKPADRNEDLHYWLQRKAARILGAYGDPGAGNAVADALAKILSDSKRRPWLRYEAAAALGSLKFPSPAAANVDETVKQIGELALKSLRDEAAWLNGQILFLQEQEVKRKNTMAAGTASDEYAMRDMGGGEEPGMSDEERMMMEMGGMDGMDGMFATEPEDEGGAAIPSAFGHPEDPESELPDYKLDISRRRIKTAIYYLQQALGPPDNSAGLGKYCKEGEAKKLFDAIQSGIAKAKVLAHMGVDDKYEALTLDMIDTISANADLLVSTMGIVEEIPAETVKRRSRRTPASLVPKGVDPKAVVGEDPFPD